MNLVCSERSRLSTPYWNFHLIHAESLRAFCPPIPSPVQASQLAERSAETYRAECPPGLPFAHETGDVLLLARF